MIIYSNIDTLLSGKFQRWSENILNKVQDKPDLFSVIGDDHRSDDGTRANELFRLGLFSGSLLGKKAGWNLLMQDKNIHSRLGFLSYIIGKVINLKHSTEKIERAYSALCTLYALQTGDIIQGKTFSVIGLSFYVRKYFPKPEEVNEIKYWRYLTALIFCTYYDETLQKQLFLDYFTLQPIKTLYLVENNNKIPVDYTTFLSYISSNRSINNITPIKYSLFWVGKYQDIKPRGLFSQSLLVGGKLLQIAADIEHNAIKQNQISPFNTIINKNDSNVIPCILESLQSIFNNHPQGKIEFQNLMKTLYEGVNDALMFINPPIKLPIIEGFKAYNRIYFGCPGTGKSTIVEGEIKDNYQETITFHPEFDYASFIGCYKPFTEIKGEEKIISYQFVAQAFIKLYVEAWKNLDKAYYFVIEEINRGNCAAIFGDIFQLLDRDLQGYSRYFISIDSDLANYLENELKDNSGYTSVINSLYLQKRKTACKNPYQIMLLPNNLSILATMNTSDQSLFPMDSAFKRRWEWKYIAIDYEKAKKIQLKISGNSYNWGEFLLSINKQIFEITESEDKQMGTFFVVPDEKSAISEEVFLNKVLFYLWYDVLKNEGKETIAKVFPDIKNEGFHYAAFFALSEEEKQSWLKAFFELHNIPAISNVSEQNENPT